MTIDYKLTVIIVDDFTSRSFSEFSAYDIQYYDYAKSYQSYFVDSYGKYSGTDYGDVDATGIVSGTTIYDWYNVKQLTGLSSDPFAGNVYAGSSLNNLTGLYYGYDPQVSDYYYYNNIDSVTSWTNAVPGHGDWVLKAFTDKLVDPSDVEIIAVDIDYDSSGDLSSLFSGVSLNGKTVPFLTALYTSAVANDLHQANEYHFMVGLNASFITGPSSIAAVSNLLQSDMLIVQAAPNVNANGFDWGQYLSNVINVGAWNKDSSGYALAGNINSLDTIDIYANGYIQRAGWGSGWNFGTSFATPRVFADIVNYLDQNVLPVFDAGSISPPSGTTNLSGAQETTITNALIDAISSPYTITFSGVPSPVGPVNVSNSTISQFGVQPVSVPYSDPTFGYVVVSAQRYNNLPTGSVSIYGTATQGQTLTASNNLADLDGLGTIAYQWKADGTSIAGATSSTFTLTQAQVGKAITVVASYQDLLGANESVASSAISSIANVNDLPTGSVTISGTATQGQVLTASNSLADLDGLGAIAYQWKADGTNIGGATSSTFTLTQAQVGKAITVVASYQDVLGANESVASSATSSVANVNDSPTGSVTISGNATQGQALTASNNLADLDGLGTIAYQWQADGTNIGGATSSTFTLTQAQVGKAITVIASYQDVLGANESVASSATSSVANVNDLPTGSVTIFGTATQGQTLTASNNLADLDGLGTIAYQWKADGTNIGGATSSTFTLTQAQVGKVITVVASYQDVLGANESVASSATSSVTDLIAPILASSVPADNASSVYLSSNLVLSFSESVHAGTGNIVLTNLANSADSRAIAVTDSSQITFSGADVTINPSANLLPGAHYAITMASGVILDNVNNLFAGISSNIALDFTAASTANVSGQVYSWKTHVLMDDVVVTPSTGSAGSSIGGHYDLSNLEVGDFTFAASRTVTNDSTGSAITSADALAALKIAVGINPNTDPDGVGPRLAATLSPYQLMAADVNGDGRVTSADALAILKMAVKLPTAVTPTWIFADENQTFSLTSSNVNYNTTISKTLGADETINMVAVLKGDVNGSWGTSAATSTHVDYSNSSYFANLATNLHVTQDVWGIS